MANLISTTPAEIDAIKAHIAAGNQVVIRTYTKTTVIPGKAPYTAYINADKDGKGFRLGWPGKKQVYAFADSVHLVPAGYRI